MEKSTKDKLVKGALKTAAFTYALGGMAVQTVMNGGKTPPLASAIATKKYERTRDNLLSWYEYYEDKK